MINVKKITIYKILQTFHTCLHLYKMLRNRKLQPLKLTEINQLTSIWRCSINWV